MTTDQPLATGRRASDPILRFKHHLRAEVVGPDRVFLVGEKERFLLQGKAYAVAASHLDGQRSVMDIVALTAAEVSAPEMFQALTMLEEKGYATAEVPAGLAAESAAFWDAAGVAPGRAERLLGESTVAVETVGSTSAHPVHEALSEIGIGVSAGASLTVAVTDDYVDPALATFNQRALAAGKPWLPLKIAGVEAWIGPIFSGRGQPCWACLATRLRTNRSVETHLAQQRGRAATAPVARLTTTMAVAARLAALRLADYLVRGQSGALADKLTTVGFAPLTVTEHLVSARPQCATCGDASLMKKQIEAPVTLVSRPKRFTADGGHRVMTPEETLHRCEPQVSPITGVIAKLGPLPGRDHPLRPVAVATYFTVPVDERPAFSDFAGVSMGKGRTPAQARAGALSEALERTSAVLQGDEPLVQARLADLGTEAIGPDELQGFSAAQFANRDAFNAQVRDRRRMIPRRFEADEVLAWTPAWSLTHARRRYLPANYCFLGTPTPPEGKACFYNPNGHAGGNCLEEAILQAAFELAERDAVGIWWYNRVVRPPVDLDTFGQPYFRALVQDFAGLGHDLWVLDVTNDLGVPSFAALSRQRDSGRFCAGFGSHFDARLGVQRALTELNQIFDPTGRLPPPWPAEAVIDPRYLFPDEGRPAKRADDYPAVASQDLRDDVERFVAQTAAVGLETIVLDQSRPDTRMQAVKVVVPGLRHFWPRFGPGRLFDVPVRLGWRNQPCPEAELNPVPLFV